MGAIAVFNYPAWVARYPEFATVSEPTADAYFAEAQIFHANDGSGPVNDATQQLVLLNMMTAHIAARYAIINGEPPSPLIGNITNATEGSVSVGVKTLADAAPGTQAWLVQTKYGSDYWFATAVFRSFMYRAPWPRNVDPYSPMGPWGGGWGWGR